MKVKKLVVISMLSSIAFVLMLLNFPFPGLPDYLKIDFSDVPAIIAILIYGPLAGIAVEAIKNVLQYIIQGSMAGVPVGQIANFIAGTLFILPTAFLFKAELSKGLGCQPASRHCSNDHFDEYFKLCSDSPGIHVVFTFAGIIRQRAENSGRRWYPSF